jgi:hypothetical protein
MRWIVLVLCASCALGACGGPKIPMHSGYRNDKLKPWKGAKKLALDDKLEAKADGDLSYAAKQRARWYAIEIPRHGELALRLEITPPGEAANDDFDLALEILDPGFRVISKSDLEDEDAHELTKTKTLFDLEPGKYLIHLYLQSRMDTADYGLRVTFKPTTAAELKSDFPTQVAFIPSLPMVPLADDTPKNRMPKTVVIHTGHTPKPKPVATDPKPVTTMTARIVGVSVVTGGTKIVIGIGSSRGATTGMKAKLTGIATTSEIECDDIKCSAIIKATPDQVRGAGGSVTLLP